MGLDPPRPVDREATEHFDSTTSASSNCSTSNCSSCCGCSCSEELARCRHELSTACEELQQCRQDLRACQDALRKREEELWIYRDALMSGDGPSAAAASNLSQMPGVRPPGDAAGVTQHAISEYPLLTDFLPPGPSPLVVSVEQVKEIADRHCLRTQVWQFAEMEPGETLQVHVQRQIESGTCPDPSIEPMLKFVSRRTLKDINAGSMEEGIRRISSWFRNLAALWTEWQTSLKNLQAASYDPFLFRAVLFGDANTKSQSKPWNIINWPAVILGADGKRYWGMIRQNGPASLRFQLMWSLRDLLIVKHSPITINTVDADNGSLLWQNAASMAMFGCRGMFSARISMMGWNDSFLDGEAASYSSTREGQARSCSMQRDNFVELLLGRDAEKLAALRSTVQSGKIFCTRQEILDPLLRSWMRLQPGTEVHHDVQVTLSSDPITLQKVYTVSQIDVTDVVLAQRELAEEKQRAHALLQRQYELIACLGKVTEVGQSPANNASAAELIDGVRRKIATLGMEDRGVTSGVDKIEIQELLGEGSYGKVYKGLWRGTVVAVKSMILPFGMTGAEKHERMAIMEAGISASLSHPNVVQTYTYSIQPVRDTESSARGDEAEPTTNSAKVLSSQLLKMAMASRGAEGDSTPTFPSLALDAPGGTEFGDRPSTQRRSVYGGDRLSIQRSVVYTEEAPRRPEPEPGAGGMRGFEMRLVLEYCDCGTLRDALDKGMFLLGREVNYPAVCETAADIAKGMLQLHSMNVVHSDLKARNVLLRSDNREARGVTAKIADFGLSFKMDHLETHVSSVYHGTLTHMAPEVLLQGCQSKASDVYAFGITLWELYTAGRPFQGVPQALIGHQISRENRRPVFTTDAPQGYVQLAERCWDATPGSRPTFEEILEALLSLRRQLAQPTSALKVDVAPYVGQLVPGPRLAVSRQLAPQPGPAAPGTAAAASLPAAPPTAPQPQPQMLYFNMPPPPQQQQQQERQEQEQQLLVQECASTASSVDISHAIICTTVGSTVWDHRGPLVQGLESGCTSTSGPVLAGASGAHSSAWDSTCLIPGSDAIICTSVGSTMWDNSPLVPGLSAERAL